MMYGGYDIWGFISMAVMMAVLAVAIILVVRYASHGMRGDGRALHESPLDVLKKRYAKGEIDKKEYDEKRKDLAE